MANVGLINPLRGDPPPTNQPGCINPGSTFPRFRVRDVERETIQWPRSISLQSEIARLQKPPISAGLFFPGDLNAAFWHAKCMAPMAA